MDLQQQRIFLIRELLKEQPQFKEVTIPVDPRRQQDLLRSLMNLRPPLPISSKVLQVQDQLLQGERDQRGVVDSDQLSPIPGEPQLVLWQGDITTLKVDAIVNAANSGMLGCFYPLHSCIDNIIHSRSGIQLRLFCHQMMEKQGHPEPTGTAKMTPAFNLPSKYILHTVGPIIDHPLTRQDGELLASCYRSCLQLAVESHCRSIAFCCISTGEFHFPRKEAAQIAVNTVRHFLAEKNESLRVIFNVFQDEDLRIYQQLLKTDC